VFAMLQSYVITVIVVIFVCQLIFTWLSFNLYKQFGWKVYKKIGADLQKKNMYRSFHIFLLLLKLDFFFFLGFAIQLMMLVLTSTDVETYLTIVAIPIIFFVLIGAVFGVERENRAFMLAFMFGLGLAIAYFVYKTVRIYTDPNYGTQNSIYFGVSIYLTVFAILSLLMTLATLYFSIVCYLNFDKGLKPFHLAQKKGRVDTEDMMQEGGGGRFVLDDDDDVTAVHGVNMPPDYPVTAASESTFAAGGYPEMGRAPKPLPPPPARKIQPVFNPQSASSAVGSAVGSQGPPSAVSRYTTGGLLPGTDGSQMPPTSAFSDVGPHTGIPGPGGIGGVQRMPTVPALPLEEM